jgi:hypothetical protein
MKFSSLFFGDRIAGVSPTTGAPYDFSEMKYYSKRDPFLNKNKNFQDFIKQQRMNELVTNPRQYLNKYINEKKRVVADLSIRARNYFERMLEKMTSRKDAIELAKKYFQISKQKKFEMIDQIYDANMIKKAKKNMKFQITSEIRDINAVPDDAAADDAGFDFGGDSSDDSGDDSGDNPGVDPKVAAALKEHARKTGKRAGKPRPKT